MKLVELDLIGVLLALSLLIVPAGFALASGQDAPLAQAPALAGSGLDPTPQPAWLAKVNAAVNDTTDLALTCSVASTRWPPTSAWTGPKPSTRPSCAGLSRKRAKPPSATACA